jgi:hypothetical protein
VLTVFVLDEGFGENDGRFNSREEFVMQAYPMALRVRAMADVDHGMSKD